MCNESEAVGRVMTNRNNNPGLQDVLADLAAAQTAVRRSSRPSMELSPDSAKP